MCIAVGLASVDGAPALAAGTSASAPQAGQPAATARPAAPYYSTRGGLAGVAAAAANNAWAVGHAGTGSGVRVLILHWNGSKWSRVTSPGVLTATGELNAITVVSARDAWAVGSTGTAGKSHTLLLHWNGSTWRQVTSPAPVAGALNAVTATASRGWAVGYVQNGHNFPNPLALRLSGTTWSRITMSGGIDVIGVAITGASSAWALADNEQASQLGHWNGSRWTWDGSILPNFRYVMTGIAAGQGGTAFTVGTNHVGADGTPVTVSLRLTGSSWHAVTVHAPANSQLNAVTFAPGGGAWTAGAAYTVGRTQTVVLRWTGSAWTRVATPSPGSSDSISGLGFAAAGNGWAVGTSGASTLILHWNGKGWR